MSNLGGIDGVRTLVLALSVIAITACGGPAAAPSGAALPTYPLALYLDNRGGPAFVVAINQHDVETIRCDSGAQITVGDSGIPNLRWDVSLRHAAGGTVFLAQHIEHLPLYFTQIGDEPQNQFSTVAVAGPPGPTCPRPVNPVETQSAHRGMSNAAEKLQGKAAKGLDVYQTASAY